MYACVSLNHIDLWLDAPESRYQMGEKGLDSPEVQNAESALILICGTNFAVKGVEGPGWDGIDVDVASAMDWCMA